MKDITNDLVETNEPYSFLSRIADAVWNFLVMLGVLATICVAGYLRARYL